MKLKTQIKYSKLIILLVLDLDQISPRNGSWEAQGKLQAAEEPSG